MPDLGTAFRIEEDPSVALVEVVGWTPSGLTAIFGRHGWPLPPRPGATARHGETLLVRITPCIAWVIGGAGDLPAGNDGCACDLSHSHVRFRFDGAKTTTILSKTVALDMDEGAWPVGNAAATAIHGMSVLIHRREVQAFDVLVPRSFARSIGEWIRESALEIEPGDGRPFPSSR